MLLKQNLKFEQRRYDKHYKYYIDVNEITHGENKNWVFGKLRSRFFILNDKIHGKQIV